MIEQSK